MLSSSELVAASSDYSQLKNALCLCSPVLPAQAVQERCHKSLAIDFAVKLCSGIAFWSDCQMTSRDSNLDSNLNSAA